MRTSHQQEVNNYYTDTTHTWVYRSQIQAFGKDMTGHLIIRAMAPNTHRLALVSDLGQTILDVSVFPDRHELHAAMADINKKILVKELAWVFRSLTERRYVQNALIFMDKQHYPVYVVDDHFYSMEERHLADIVVTKNGKERFHVSFDDVQRKLPKNITIQHKKYPVAIQLKLDEKQSVL
ncbi:hypothetical protein [Sphingobacterium griseoflavum]|uniref:Uncharacterized protein n=1 Tax=Sphingobacterium griseoflavum TaxID=1474952 RepID=A0ABQ3HX69_9SPHI|nr:hypothetical protein [Sphingobacterium griseoflavum]GHE40666.1 hypothetical protein GCM10017764_24870 [Sphingobacterium griseoflavum]